jgi:uridine kinase
MSRPIFIGLCGGSGSGKTHFLRALLGHFTPAQICLVSQDNYYKAKALQPLDTSGIENFDMPESVDEERFYEDLMRLSRYEKVTLPEYTFNNPDTEPRWLEFLPAPIILVEGILVYHYPRIRSLFDLRLFIDARESVKIHRRILRDEKERGYDLHDVLYRYVHHVTPVYEKFIAPYKDDVDLVIPNNRGFEKALHVLVAYLESRLMTGKS